MDTKKTKLRISFQGAWNVIRIGKGVVKVLGEPEYICLRVNERMDILAIRPCGPCDQMSFKVPPDFTKRTERLFRIISKRFVRSFLEQNHLNPDITYSVDGEYSEADHAVFFDMTRAGKAK